MKPFPRIKEFKVGAPGTVTPVPPPPLSATGVAETGLDAGPEPTAFLATTRHECDTPFVNPATTIGLAVAVGILGRRTAPHLELVVVAVVVGVGIGRVRPELELERVAQTVGVVVLIRELADRLDGKSIQAKTVTAQFEKSVPTKIQVRFIQPDPISKPLVIEPN